jgi:DNA-binding NtrC family response regulator
MSQQKMKVIILILDDEESIRFSFHRFLTAEGHHVTTAASYSEALEQMECSMDGNFDSRQRIPL